MPIQHLDDDVEGTERRRISRRRLFWWLFTRSSAVLSLMTIARLVLIMRMRMKKIRWLENPYAFDTRSLLELKF